MSFTLVLNSSNIANTSTNTSFKYNFVQGGFTADDCEICVSSVSIPYSWNNVSTYYNNKTFTLIFPTAATTVTYSIVLPDGFYTVTDINYFIQQTCISNGAYLIDSSLNNVYFTNMAYNATFYSIQVLLFSVPTSLVTTGMTYTRPATGLYSATGTGLPTTAYTPQLVIPTSGSIGTIIGFSSGTFPAAQTVTSQSFLSTLTPIGTTVNSLVIQCSLVSNRVTVPSDILDSMPITNTSFGSNLVYDPSFEKYVKIANGTYNGFTITFRDQNLNDIYAKDPNASITLMIRKK